MMIWIFINGWQKTSYRLVSRVVIMILVGLSIGLNESYADEDDPSFELLELLGQFEQQDEPWVDNELDPDNKSGFKNEPNNEIQTQNKLDSSGYINE